jgi:uncharacterized protein with PCYCGC motif
MAMRVLAALAVLAGGGCGSDEAPAASSPPVPQAGSPAAEVSRAPGSGRIAFTPPPPSYLGELPPLPMSPYPAQRAPEVIRAVYTFAARHPEVLLYVPCFCGCQNSGHRGNDDCFVKSRDPNGRPTWEPHGMT